MPQFRATFEVCQHAYGRVCHLSIIWVYGTWRYVSRARARFRHGDGQRRASPPTVRSGQAGQARAGAEC